jgi:hypothetical protein
MNQPAISSLNNTVRQPLTQSLQGLALAPRRKLGLDFGVIHRIWPPTCHFNV